MHMRGIMMHNIVDLKKHLHPYSAEVVPTKATLKTQII